MGHPAQRTSAERGRVARRTQRLGRGFAGPLGYVAGFRGVGPRSSGPHRAGRSAASAPAAGPRSAAQRNHPDRVDERKRGADRLTATERSTKRRISAGRPDDSAGDLRHREQTGGQIKRGRAKRRLAPTSAANKKREGRSPPVFFKRSNNYF